MHSSHEVFKEGAEREDPLAVGGDLVQLGAELQVEGAEREVHLARI